jgi:hypothetical protein
MGIIAWIVLGLVRAEKRRYQDRQPLVDERRVYQDKPPL